MSDGKPSRTSFTYELDNDQQELLLGLMANGNFRRRETPYALCSVEGDHFNATLYAKEKHGRRKLCVQGSKAEEFVLFQLEPLVLCGASLGYEDVLDPERSAPHAGSDESGKGDYFGPLVVCCAYTDETLSAEMEKLGVKDCKRMSDKSVLTVGAGLRRLLGPDGFAVVKLGPAAYNRLYAKIRNINRMLAWAHATAIEELLAKRPGCGRVVVDQFAPTEAVILRSLKERGKKAEIVQRHKAESDIAVAAASVIARELFLRDVAAMGDEIFGAPAAGADGGAEKQTVPMGSSDPRVREVARKMAFEKGAAWLMNHCKAHFRTTDKVLEACGMTRAELPPEGRVVSAAERTDDLKKKNTTGKAKQC
ncbi:MAG: ribonuclease HIII [Kiritimatiellae bacterium]|nr:ribonuclease HIII [Kiritimatiellia bacterium]